MKRFRGKAPWLMILAGGIFLVFGCSSSSDPEPPAEPTGMELATSAGEVLLGGTVEVEASFLYDRSETPECDWYVDGVLGGSVAKGTISQDNPATYTAPVIDPGVESVTLMAVWQDDEEIGATETLDLQVPVVALAIENDQLQVGETSTVTATLEAPRSATDFDWYVNDVLGGDATSGTISQDNPATYTAPQAVPVGGSAEITAKWRDNPLIMSSDLVGIRFTVKHVNAATGVDAPENGTITAPFLTLDYAVDQVEQSSGDTILLAPGTYGPTSGVSVRRGVTIMGADRDQCFVEADAEASNAIFWSNLESTLQDLTLTNPAYPESDIHYAIQCQGSGTVRNIKVNDSFKNSVIYVVNTDVAPLIEDCELVCTHGTHEDEGIRASTGTLPVIRNCVIEGWYRGYICTGRGGGLMEGCTFRNNLTGIYLSDDESQPDLGGGAHGSLGGNTIQMNDKGLHSRSDLDIHALYNTWTYDPPVEGPTEPYDYYSEGAGTIILE